MAVQKFEDLIVWQKAQNLACEVYGNFSSCKDFGFKDQIQRASVSISNNISEGFDRSSNKDFSRFLYMAAGSSSEVRSMLYLSIRLNFIKPEEANNMIAASEEISRIIYGLINSMKR